ncbi:hypothetical protein HYQ45_006382 [Verticillium longisporum]|nr:hypothetical protein HYQ45_006382 [Verticillium longisporum]CRJ88997.1 hypothetical protein BN1723_008416 [Verticillium longisporum]
MTSFIYARQYDGEISNDIVYKIVLATSICTTIIALLSFVVRILLSKRRGHRILNLNFALTLLALIMGLIAVALFISFTTASHNEWLRYNLGQFFASIATGLSVVSIVGVLFSHSRNTESSSRGLLSLLLILGLSYLIISFWPLHCGRLLSPAATFIAKAFSWTHGALLTTTFLLLLVASALEKRGPTAKQVSTRHRALVAILYLIAIILVLSNAFYVALNSDVLYGDGDNEGTYTDYEHVYADYDYAYDERFPGVNASISALMIFLVAFLAANIQAQGSPAKPEETEAKENHAAPNDQVDGPASCSPSTEGNLRDSMFIIQGARVPGYREPTGQDVQRARDFHKSPPPTGILRTISVDVVVEDREEDEWHDAEGQRGTRGWEAALRRGPQ